jgi:hypothetical protein
MPAFGVNARGLQNANKYKDLQAETCRFAAVGSTFRVGKPATGHNVTGISVYTQ